MDEITELTTQAEDLNVSDDSISAMLPSPSCVHPEIPFTFLT